MARALALAASLSRPAPIEAARGAIVAPSDRNYENMAIAAKESQRIRIMNSPMTPDQRAAALERLK